MSSSDRRQMTDESMDAPFYVAWRIAQGADPGAFWSAFGVSRSCAHNYEAGDVEVPKCVLVLIVLHRLGVVTLADLEAFPASVSATAGDDSARLAQHRKGLGLSQDEFWVRFGIDRNTGSRYERGWPVSQPLYRLVALYRAGKITDVALASAHEWLALHGPGPNVRCAPVKGAAITDDMYGISHVVAPSGKEGYRVELTRRGDRYRRWFGASRHGGLDGALAAAQQWRDKSAASLPLVGMREFVSKIRKNNTSGVAGVVRIERCYKDASGRCYRHPTWVAKSPGSMKARTRSFAVSIYGEAHARQLAIVARKEFEAQCAGFRSTRVPERYLSADLAHDDHEPEVGTTGQYPAQHMAAAMRIGHRAGATRRRPPSRKKAKATMPESKAQAPEFDITPNAESVREARRLLGDLVSLRRKSNRNQQQFWRKYGAIQSAGSRYETGRPLPTPVRMLLLLEGMGHVSEERMIEVARLVERIGRSIQEKG